LQAIPGVSKGRRSAFRKLMNLRGRMRLHFTAPNGVMVLKNSLKTPFRLSIAPLSC
jgi:hypothetical protein